MPGEEGHTWHTIKRGREWNKWNTPKRGGVLHVLHPKKREKRPLPVNKPVNTSRVKTQQTPHLRKGRAFSFDPVVGAGCDDGAMSNSALRENRPRPRRRVVTIARLMGLFRYSPLLTAAIAGFALIFSGVLIVFAILVRWLFAGRRRKRLKMKLATPHSGGSGATGSQG